MKKPFFISAMFAACALSRAQPADTMQLSEVAVTDYRSKLGSEHFNTVKLDSATRSAFAFGSAAQALLQLNACFVKAYGPANIASLSMRGSTAQQTAVVWNGININNPMLGQADVSLVPLSLFEDVSLQRGGLSALWGSGAMAGVLNLANIPNESPLAVRAGASYSDLKNFVQHAGISFRSGRWFSATKVLVDHSANQYRYYSSDTSSMLTQAHAEARQAALLQDLSFRISDKQQAGLHIWLQQAGREVPHTLQEIKQDARQEDRLLRVVGDWNLKQKRFAITARTAFVTEELKYDNRTYHVNSVSRFSSLMADLEGQYFFAKGFILTAGSSNALNVAGSKGYAKEETLSRLAFYSNLGWKFRKLQAAAYGRLELFQMQDIVPTGGVNLSLQAHKHLVLRLNGSTVYRYPTLNDLHWQPGGNPALRPENGYSAEGSAKYEITRDKMKVSASGAVFTRSINNWIMWLPGRSGMWSPQNVLEVWSRGGETNVACYFSGQKFSCGVQVNTNYVRSTRMKAVLENDESVGRQLPYVPMYSGSGVLFAMYRAVSVRMAYNYAGYRYLTSDNYNYLSPYSLIDARVGYALRLKRTVLEIFAEGNNLLNEIYFSVAQYPMPLRNFRVGIQVQYHKNKESRTKNQE